jgi:putative photosynthetic complex assembly protein
MSHHDHQSMLPRKALYALMALVVFSLVAVSLARLAGVSPRQAPVSAVSATIDLRFADRADGAVVVTDARDGSEVAVLPPESNGFVRGVLRSLVRERRASGLGEDAAFSLARHADGRLTLVDPDTGRVIELNSFGPSNEGAFAVLLERPDRVVLGSN